MTLCDKPGRGWRGGVGVVASARYVRPQREAAQGVSS